VAVTDRTHLDILVPELPSALERAWPSASARRIADVLARAARYPAAQPDYEHALLALCGIADSGAAEGSPPLAGASAICDLGLPVAAVPAGLVRADPVHLRADPTRLVLFDAETVGLDDDEADALLALLNEAFAADGHVFRRGAAATRWYVELAFCPATPGTSPARLRGLPLAPDAAARRAHAGLERLLTEVQMVLYECPINIARERAGKAPVNSIWLWGGGALPRPQRPRLSRLVSSDFLARACAAYAGTPALDTLAALPGALHAAQGGLAVICAPDSDEAQPDRFVHEVLDPVLAALRGGRLGSAAVHCTAGEYRLSRWSRWRIWRGGDALIAAWRALHATQP
jgi:hypothetical protein